MQIKTIKSVLAKKIKAWADSISDPAVKKIVEEQTIVTGGATARQDGTNWAMGSIREHSSR